MVQKLLKQAKQQTVSQDECANILERSGWLSDLTWPQLKSLASYFTVFEVPPSAEVCAEGDTDAFLGLVAKGNIAIEKIDVNGKTKALTTLGPGKALGEISLVDGSPSSARAVAKDQVLLLVLEKNQFNQILEDKPVLGIVILKKIITTLSQRLRRTSGQLVDRL